MIFVLIAWVSVRSFRFGQRTQIIGLSDCLSWGLDQWIEFTMILSAAIIISLFL